MRHFKSRQDKTFYVMLCVMYTQMFEWDTSSLFIFLFIIFVFDQFLIFFFHYELIVDLDNETQKQQQINKIKKKSDAHYKIFEVFSHLLNMRTFDQ